MRLSKRNQGVVQKRGSIDREIERRKLSAMITAIAQPWIERLGRDPPLPAVEFAYKTCGAVWNASRLEDATARKEIVCQLRDGVISAAPKGTETEVQQLFDMLYERALVAWPTDRRMVVNLVVVDLARGSFRVDVASVAGGSEA